MTSDLDEYYSKEAISQSLLKRVEAHLKFFGNLDRFNEEYRKADSNAFFIGKQLDLAIDTVGESLRQLTYIPSHITTPSLQARKFMSEFVLGTKSKFDAYCSYYNNATSREGNIAKCEQAANVIIQEHSEYYTKLLHSNINQLTLIDEVLGGSGEKIYKTIEALYYSVVNNSIAKAFMLESDTECYNQLAIYWNEIVGNVSIKCKALLDRVVIDHDHKVVYLIDTKTTNQEGTQSYKKFRYAKQIAWYEQALSYWLSRHHLVQAQEYTIKRYICSLKYDELDGFIVANCNMIPISQHDINKAWNGGVLKPNYWTQRNENGEYDTYMNDKQVANEIAKKHILPIPNRLNESEVIGLKETLEEYVKHRSTSSYISTESN